MTVCKGVDDDVDALPEELNVSTIGHVRKFVVKAECRDELMEALRMFVEEAGREEGTLLYLIHTVRDHPNTVWTYERYRDQAAYEAHADSPLHRTFKARFMDLVDETEATKLDLIDGKGLPSSDSAPELHPLAIREGQERE